MVSIFSDAAPRNNKKILLLNICFLSSPALLEFGDGAQMQSPGFNLTIKTFLNITALFGFNHGVQMQASGFTSRFTIDTAKKTTLKRATSSHVGRV